MGIDLKMQMLVKSVDFERRLAKLLAGCRLWCASELVELNRSGNVSIVPESSDLVFAPACVPPC